MKKLLLVIFHFFAESKTAKSGIARPEVSLRASEPGIIPLAGHRRAGLFTTPGETRLVSAPGVQGKAERA